MKYFLIAVIIAFAAIVSAEDNLLKLSEEQRTRVRGFAKECLESEGVTKEAVGELKKGNFAGADAKLKNFSNCFLEKLGFLVNGVPQEDVIKAKLTPLVGEAELAVIIGKCNGLKGDNNAETAFKIYECYYTNHASYL